MSQTIDEIIRVTKAAGKPLTANAIYQAGAFSDIQPVYVAVATMCKGDNPALIRSTPLNGGRYEYAFNPDYKFKNAADTESDTKESKQTAPAAAPRRVNGRAGEASESSPTKTVPQPATAVTIPKFTGEAQEPKRPEHHTNLTPLRARFEAERETLTARLAEVTKALDAIDTLQKAIG